MWWNNLLRTLPGYRWRGSFLVFLIFFLASTLSTYIAPRTPFSESRSRSLQQEDPSHQLRNKGFSPPIPLPSDFDQSIESRLSPEPDSRFRQHHGDPAPLLSTSYPSTGRGASSGRGFFSFWPFSIEITKGKGKGPGFEHGGVHGQDGGWGPHGSSGFGLFKGITFKAASHHKGHHHDDHGGGHDHKPTHGWGWEAAIEKEKHQLRYEILKLKAKKKIALLQNTVELKKLFSIILQKIVQALEWWR